MADEVFDGTDVVRQVFREGQRVTDEAGDALPHGVIEALDMISFAGVLRNGFVLRRRNDPCVDVECLNRLSSVDQFLDSRCQSRFSSAWWGRIFKASASSRSGQPRSTALFVSV